MLAQCQGFLFLFLPLASRLRMGKRLGETQPGQLSQRWRIQYSILCDIVLSSRSSGKGAEKEDIWGYGNFLPKQPWGVISIHESSGLPFYPQPTREESEQDTGWVFGCWPGSTHHIYIQTCEMIWKSFRSCITEFLKTLSVYGPVFWHSL